MDIFRIWGDLLLTLGGGLVTGIVYILVWGVTLFAPFVAPVLVLCGVAVALDKRAERRWGPSSTPSTGEVLLWQGVGALGEIVAGSLFAVWWAGRVLPYFAFSAENPSVWGFWYWVAVAGVVYAIVTVGELFSEKC